jgi:hypothetical protein
MNDQNVSDTSQDNQDTLNVPKPGSGDTDSSEN